MRGIAIVCVAGLLLSGMGCVSSWTLAPDFYAPQPARAPLPLRAALLLDEAPFPLVRAFYCGQHIHVESDAALRAAYVTPQIFGGLGVMEDGPVFQVARRIRQLASYPPGAERADELTLGLYGL